MNPVFCPTAWDHPPTRRVWLRYMVVNALGFISSAASWLLLLAISTYTPQWVVWIMMPCFLYGLYRVAAQCKILLAGFLMPRILRTYPWQIVRDAPRGLADRHEVVNSQFGWFEFPNPGRKDHWLPLVFPTHLGTRWWAKRMAPRAKPRLQAQIETLWFAGDPRFIGIVAAPNRNGAAPRRLHVLEQRVGERSGQRFTDWCATSEDIERGRRAGVRPVRPGTAVRGRM